MQEHVEDLFCVVISAERVLKGDNKGILFVNMVEAGALSDVQMALEQSGFVGPAAQGATTTKDVDTENWETE